METKKKNRKYFPADFNAEKWTILKAELKKMEKEVIESTADLINFIEKYNELSAIIKEIGSRKYIGMHCSINNKEFEKSYLDFIKKISSKANSYFFEFDKKICNNPYAVKLPEYYQQMIKIISSDVKIFRSENIPLSRKEIKLSNQYQKKFSRIKVKFEGQEQRVDQILKIFRSSDRKRRKSAWKAFLDTMVKEKAAFDKLFDELKEIRIKMAQNAGFNNFRDYTHQKKRRDYTTDDVIKLHRSVEKIVVPFLKEQNETRRKKLKTNILKPWDLFTYKEFLAASFERTLEPFKSDKELIKKTIKIAGKIDPEFAKILKGANRGGFLDLKNRESKASGGYSRPMPESLISFILMNAVGSAEDVRSLLHEFGHMVHTVKKLMHKVAQYRNTPQEIEEMAAMSMELLAIDHLSEFYPDNKDLAEAKKEILERAVSTLPWIVAIDAFQHWIYLNPNHTPEERANYFGKLMQRFDTGVDWSGLEEERKALWISQLHVFVLPFYYIEYAIAQLGAIATYRNYKINKKEALEKYKKFLSLGYSKPIREVYKAGGIEFNFSEKYIEEIINFVKDELKQLE